ncbi:MAG: trigger factor family protein, partial [Proteobacteria bacterium]|nr:trigger factor family protein [Pseudomonadota bacterium]
MKVTTEKPEPGVATLTVELPPEDFTTAVDKALTRIAGRTSVPGFRRGKAPRNLVRRQVGEAAVNEEAINHLVPESYDKACWNLESCASYSGVNDLVFGPAPRVPERFNR